MVGVGPDGFTGTEPGRPADLFVPAVMNVEALDKPGWGWFQLWVRPRDGVPISTVGEILEADQRREQEEALRQIPQDALSGSTRSGSGGWNCCRRRAAPRR